MNRTQMPHAPDLSGVALDGRYELHALIGEGSFGRVYRGRDRRLARGVAVKVIKPWWAEDPEWVRSFEREAQLLASISDSGIVQIFDVGFAAEGLYYVAELVDGESLASRLRRGRLIPWEACDIAEQLARALARAHEQRVVHRDVKPANVLIASDGRIKVGDFGVARLAEGSSDVAAGTVVGTPAYMAPEQARGELTSPATDVYGMGVVLYEMLAGHPPFAGKSAVELAVRHLHDEPPPLSPGSPRALVLIVERALAKDPAERYPDGRAMALALAQARTSAARADEDRGVAYSALDPAAAGRDGVLASALTTSVLTPVRSRSAPANVGAATQVLTHTDRRAANGNERARPERIAPTRIGEPMSPRRNVNPAERRQRMAIFALVLMITAGLVAAALAIAPGHVRVPELRRMTRPRISAMSQRLNLRATFTSRYSHAPRGTAIAQSPVPGTRVSDGTTVRVTLSDGPPPVAVPQLVGTSATDARAILGGLKLRIGVAQVPAPGVAVGTVTRQSPGAGASLTPGSVVALSVSEAPRLRGLTSFAGDGNGRSVPFRIRGKRWQIFSGLSYEGTCTFIFVCSGPSAKVTNLSTGATVDQFALGEGSSHSRIVTSGPGIYQISISPGSDTARWTMKVDDYY